MVDGAALEKRWAMSLVGSNPTLSASGCLWRGAGVDDQARLESACRLWRPWVRIPSSPPLTCFRLSVNGAYPQIHLKNNSRFALILLFIISRIRYFISFPLSSIVMKMLAMLECPSIDGQQRVTILDQLYQNPEHR